MTSPTLLNRTIVLATSSALCIAMAACTTGTGTEPESEPGSEPAAEPDPIVESNYGSLTVRLFDNTTDEVVCETTLTSSEATPDENFGAGYNYTGIPANETALVAGGTLDVDESGGQVASVSLLVGKVSDDVYELPPGASYDWVFADVVDTDGLVGCSNETNGFDAANYFLLNIGPNAATSDLTALTIALTSATPEDGFEDGWSVPLPSNCVANASVECQLYGATGAFSLTAAGTGTDIVTGEVYRFEADFDVTKGEIAASREVE